MPILRIRRAGCTVIIPGMWESWNLPLWALLGLTVPLTLSLAPALHALAVRLPWQVQCEWGWAEADGADEQAPAPLTRPWRLTLSAGALGLALLCAWRFGARPGALLALLYCWALLLLAVIDQREMLLPDSVTQPLLWAGLLMNLNGAWAPLPQAVLGAVAGYLCLWLLFHGFRLATGKEGMGYGDFKLLAAIGAWVGVAALPAVILIAAVSGLAWGCWLLLTRRATLGAAQPFGVHLAWAGAVMLLWLGTP